MKKLQYIFVPDQA